MQYSLMGQVHEMEAGSKPKIVRCILYHEALIAWLSCDFKHQGDKRIHVNRQVYKCTISANAATLQHCAVVKQGFLASLRHLQASSQYSVDAVLLAAAWSPPAVKADCPC